MKITVGVPELACSFYFVLQGVQSLGVPTSLLLGEQVVPRQHG